MSEFKSMVIAGPVLLWFMILGGLRKLPWDAKTYLAEVHIAFPVSLWLSIPGHLLAMSVFYAVSCSPLSRCLFALLRRHLFPLLTLTVGTSLATSTNQIKLPCYI